MLNRGALTWVCLLCALACSGVASQALAATNGTTAFTCKKTAEGTGERFSKAHCKAADTSPTGEYRHVPISQNTTTEFTTTSVDTEGKPTTARIRTSISGVEVELQSTLAHGEGWMEDAIDPTTGEHYVVGESATTFTEVIFTKPAEKGCKVKGGQIVTNKLKTTTKGQGDAGKLEPASGSVFTVFEVEGCSIGVLNGLYEVTGSIKCSPDGATINCTHVSTTEQSTLKLRGQKAGLEISTTASGRDPVLGEVTYTPLSTTTVSTP